MSLAGHLKKYVQWVATPQVLQGMHIEKAVEMKVLWSFIAFAERTVSYSKCLMIT
jgi:hypothetical protein